MNSANHIHHQRVPTQSIDATISPSMTTVSIVSDKDELDIFETNHLQTTISIDDATTKEDEELNNCVVKRQRIGCCLTTMILLALSTIAFLIKPALLQSSAFVISYCFFCCYIIFLCNIVIFYLIQQIITLSNENNSSIFYDIIWYLYSKIGLISPVFTHFADTSSDIAVLIQFYQ